MLVSPYAIAATSTAVTDGSDVPALVASAGVRTAVDTARRLAGPGLALTVTTGEGPRSKVLPPVARQARLLVLPGSEGGHAHRWLSAQSDLTWPGSAYRP